MNSKASEERMEKKRQKKRRRAIIKGFFAVLLALILVAITLAPIFAETTPTEASPQHVYSSGGRVLLSEATTDSTENSDSADGESDSEASTYKEYLDFMMLMIQQSYYKEVNLETLIEGAYKGIFETLDPYSVYFTPEEYDRFSSDLQGSFVGIGASITQGEDGVEVVAPIKGTPAEAAGLKTGDVIVEIDGMDATNLTTEEAVTYIRGEEGTQVELGISRAGEPEVLYFTITRAVIELKSVYYEVLDSGIGYIELTDFNSKTNAAFDEAMAYFVNNDIDKLIVDVRNNPGGLLTTAVHVSDYFLNPDEEIVTIDYRSSTDRTYRATDEKAPMSVAVLVNEGSASASEIFAGSLQQTGNAIVIGTTSYGKGTVQTLIPLANGGAVKMTVAEYKLAGDYAVNGVGIVPDIEVPEASSAFKAAVAEMAPLSPILGETTLNVYASQQRLALLGYEIMADGSAGPETHAAVKVFQEANHLTVNGRLNPETLKAIKAATDSTDGDGDLVLQAAEAALLGE